MNICTLFKLLGVFVAITEPILKSKQNLDSGEMTKYPFKYIENKEVKN